MHTGERQNTPIEDTSHSKAPHKGRRNFLKALGASLLTTALNPNSETLTVRREQTGMETQRKFIQAREKLKQYNIGLFFDAETIQKKKTSDMSIELATPQEATSMAEVISTTISKYSPELLPKLNLKAILLANKLSRRAKQPPHIEAEDQIRLDGRLINRKKFGNNYLDKSMFLAYDQWSWLEHLQNQRFTDYFQAKRNKYDSIQESLYEKENFEFGFHHEMYHALHRTFTRSPEFLDAWSKLKQQNTGDTSMVTLQNKNADIVHYSNPGRLPGMVTNYGIDNDTEDQAEVFGLMMTNPIVMQELTSQDPLLAKKVALMRQYTAELTNGAIDGRFWDDHFAGNIDPKYWETRTTREHLASM